MGQRKNGHAASKSTRPSRAGPTHQHPGSRGCILVADDEPAIVEVLAQLFDDAGFDVVRAYDGCQALELSRSRHPDVIVSDDYMPRLSGQQLVQKIQADRELAPTPIILMSAISARKHDTEAPFVSKPFDLEELLDLIESLVDSTSTRNADSVLPLTGPDQRSEQRRRR